MLRIILVVLVGLLSGEVRADDPSAAKEFLKQGNMSSAKGDWDKAIKEYTEAIRLDSKLSFAFNNRGNAWHAKGVLRKALDDFNEAIKLDPAYLAALYNRGNLWLDTGEYQKAIDDFTAALKIDPTNSGVFYNRALAWNGKAEYQKAIDDYTETIRLDPKDDRAYFNRGSAWYVKAQYQKAIDDYSEAIKLDPKNHRHFAMFAWLRSTNPEKKYRDGKQAVELATKACELTGWRDGVSLDILATAYAEAGDFVKAVESQKKALMLPEFEKQFGKEARDRLKLYDAKKPYRFTPGK